MSTQILQHGLEKLMLTMRTIPHLRWEQFVYRGWYALRRLMPARLCRKSMFGREHYSWGELKPCVPFPSYDGVNCADINQGRFCFLNDPVTFSGPPDWQAAGKNRLWRYNLSYFQYLLANGGLNEKTARSLIEHWIRNNPPGTRDTWDPFPTSLRLVNWLKYMTHVSPQGTWTDVALRSAFEQALWLETTLEFHLLGNHLLKNVKALIFLGLFFRGERAARWLAKGCRLLDRELDEQILADGGHFERSHMYHCMILEDVLDLLNVCRGYLQSVDGEPKCAGAPAPNPVSPPSTKGEVHVETKLVEETRHLAERLESIAARMTRFLKAMLHPDGQIALFNDAAMGIESLPAKLFQYHSQLTGEEVSHHRGPLWSFPESGYFVMAPRDGDRLIMDCGLIGPEYQPGHAHCDTLSFELSLDGHRIIVDSGCLQYEDGEMRRYNRGNQGHNSVTIDGRDQSEVWGAHRCGRRAKPLHARLWQLDDRSLVFEGAHDGYRRLPGNPVHHRRVAWLDDLIRIEDSIWGTGTHDVESRLHFHPDCTVELQDGRAMVIRGEVPIMEVATAGSGRMDRADGWYCPEFGLQIRCTVLRIIQRQVKLPHHVGWILRMSSPGCSETPR